MIEITHLTKKYGSHVAVDDVSFTVEKGKIYGFLGPNGAGKSTTMNIITGYLGATAGEVKINGFDILKQPEEAKKSVGYLPELPPLYVDMTIKEYLKFAAELKQIPKKQRKEQLEKAMEMTGILEMQNRLIRNLSKGYKQRAGLAQAILGLPEVVILDEPTVGLDPKQINEIRELIKQLGEEHTVILSSHILSEISAVCDHIFILSQGKLVASDTTENLLAQMQGQMELTLEVKGEQEAVEAAAQRLEFPLSVQYPVSYYGADADYHTCADDAGTGRGTEGKNRPADSDCASIGGKDSYGKISGTGKYFFHRCCGNGNCAAVSSDIW